MRWNVCTTRGTTRVYVVVRTFTVTWDVSRCLPKDCITLYPSQTHSRITLTLEGLLLTECRLAVCDVQESTSCHEGVPAWAIKRRPSNNEYEELEGIAINILFRVNANKRLDCHVLEAKPEQQSTAFGT